MSASSSPVAITTLAPTPAPTPLGPAAPEEAKNPIGLLFRDLLGSPLYAQGMAPLAMGPLAPAHAPAPSAAQGAASKSWSSLYNLFGSREDPNALQKQVREYEQRLGEMRDLANRQAQDISSLRSVAERTLQDQAAAPARDEERWRQLMQEASSTQEQALAHGQRQLHELASSLQAAQRAAAQQQASEWRDAFQKASESHAAVVTQMQSQLKAVSDEKLELQTLLREARKAARTGAAASKATSKIVAGPDEEGSSATPRKVALQSEKAALSAELGTLKAAHQLLEARHADLSMTNQAEARTSSALRDELGAVRSQTEAAITAAVEAEAAERKQLLHAAKEAVRSAEERLASMSARRRDLVNRLQEANGAIRVLCRCRPLSSTEMAAGEEPSMSTPAHNALCLDAGDGTRSDFSFDAAFGVDAGQRALYEEISPAVASVLSGQFVCVMAYGQTGAGKTYTMQGGGGQAGVVQLAVDELLREAASLQSERKLRGDTFEVSFEASLLEIYNERVLDLMAPPSKEPEALEVRAANDGSVSVCKLSMQPISSAEEVEVLLTKGSARRHTHGTLMNATSSRSHLVLTIYVTCKSSRDGAEQHGKLHLVDLAGSERISKSGVVGDQLKEAQHINKSLSSLEQVMLALQARQSAQQSGGASADKTHIPYRNSKLTMLLSDALGAKGACAKTIMIMQVSPSPTSCPETLRTLRFGERCQSVCLGSVRRSAAKAVDSKAAKAAEAAEERAVKLGNELIEARRAGKAAEARAKTAEMRADALQERLVTTQDQLALAKQSQPTPRQGFTSSSARAPSAAPLPSSPRVSSSFTSSSARAPSAAPLPSSPRVSSIRAPPARVDPPPADASPRLDPPRRSMPVAKPLACSPAAAAVPRLHIGGGPVLAWSDREEPSPPVSGSKKDEQPGSGEKASALPSPRRSSPRYSSAGKNARRSSPLQPLVVNGSIADARRSVDGKQALRATPLSPLAAHPAALDGAATEAGASDRADAEDAASEAYRKAYDELYESSMLSQAEGGGAISGAAGAPRRPGMSSSGVIGRPALRARSGVSTKGSHSSRAPENENTENEAPRESTAAFYRGSQTARGAPNSKPAPAAANGRAVCAYGLRPKTSRETSTSRPSTAPVTGRWR